MALISIIICTYNRAFFLQKCLDGLLSQLNNSELTDIIIVDNNSNDTTPEVINSYKKISPKFISVVEENQGLSYARNRGFYESNSEYLIYLDDDAIPFPNYINEVIRVLEENNPDIMGGPIYPYYTSNKPWWFLDEYEMRITENKSGYSQKCQIKGGNFIIRKKILEELGLFDIRYGMKGNKIGLLEERKIVEVYRRSRPQDKQRVYYSLESAVYHHTPQNKMKVSYLIRRTYKAGIAAFQMYNDVFDEYLLVRGFYQIFHTVLNLPFRILESFKKEKNVLPYILKACIDFISQITWSFGYISSQIQTFVMSKK